MAKEHLVECTNAIVRACEERGWHPQLKRGVGNQNFVLITRDGQQLSAVVRTVSDPYRRWPGFSRRPSGGWNGLDEADTVFFGVYEGERIAVYERDTDDVRQRLNLRWTALDAAGRRPKAGTFICLDRIDSGKRCEGVGSGILEGVRPIAAYPTAGEESTPLSEVSTEALLAELHRRLEA